MAEYHTPINDFLFRNGLLIKNNPAISPDLTLDFESLLKDIQDELGILASIHDATSEESASESCTRLLLWPKSSFRINTVWFILVESKTTGDCALLAFGKNIPVFDGIKTIGSTLCAIPLMWSNLIALKNAVLENDPSNTIFPKAEGSLKTTSLGIGARFTTLHWPAVAWAMKQLNLPLTANQNSIPRELVYDVNALLADKLMDVPFPFIGSSVPEGHQGQSVQGMSHGSIITFLKYGFHQNNIPWGFNADHQPIGGRFDAIEKELVEGSLFASYITYDMSPELSKHSIINDPDALETAFQNSVAPELFSTVIQKLKSCNLDISYDTIKKLVTYLVPAMKKVKRRDTLYTEIRNQSFTVEAGRHFYKELSIDELPGETTPDTMAVCLALAEVMGIQFNFVAPNIGFQKNIPYPDNKKLKKKIAELFAVAQKFGVSFGFHSGSGKSAENYRTIGEVTAGCFEIKTSGRYTYEMGVALSRSVDPSDKQLWFDWYNFTKQLVIEGAFSTNATQQSFAREFITSSLLVEGVVDTTVFNSPESLRNILDGLMPSPEHAFWFEYNFLFILAARGSAHRLGDHSREGYEQRSRFYRISNNAKLLFAQRIASYIVFLAESTELVNAELAQSVRNKCSAYTSYDTLLNDIY